MKTSTNWADMERNNNPEGLWTAILKTHMAAVIQSAAGDKARARQAYNEIRQDRTEYVAQLKRRIDSALVVVGQRRLSDEELAADFISNWIRSESQR